MPMTMTAVHITFLAAGLARLAVPLRLGDRILCPLRTTEMLRSLAPMECGQAAQAARQAIPSGRAACVRR
jgi:hypothetical protein